MQNIAKPRKRIAFPGFLCQRILAAEALAGVFVVAGLQVVQDLFDLQRTADRAAERLVACRKQEQSGH